MVKALFENLNPKPHASFLVNTFILERFTVPYHFHPELELTLIIKGKGERFVGKNMENFDAGDLVFLGSDLPHSWKSEATSDGEFNSQSIVVHFEKDFLGPEFFQKPELAGIQNLIKRSAYGIRFLNETAEETKEKMKVLAAEENIFRKMLMLLDILDDLATTKDYVLLDQDGIVAQQANNNKERINASLGYIVENFRNEILLDKVAAVANMSPNAFCKYFKRVTNKTFMETVIEYRINFAVRQLLSTDKAVADISMESGFGDISHFYKLFKKRMKTSPLNYRKKFQKGL